MELISILILLCYTVLITALIIGFGNVPLFDKKVINSVRKFSIIIPFRNEENNLTTVLNSLALLNYPKEFFEILLVNDDSDDDSVQTIENFKLRHPNLPITILQNLRKSASPKKDAIETALNKAQFEWIITTDADCSVPKNWLSSFDAFIQNNDSKLIAAPVNYDVDGTFLEQFQWFDFLSLQASSIGGFGLNTPFLCNGANLCYQKSAFIEVNGYKGNSEIASGDDIFLLEKIKNRFPEKVHYLKSKEAMVTTKPQPTFSSLLSQRVRWAAKTSSVKSRLTKLVGIVVFLMNFLLILSLFAIYIGYFNLTYLFVYLGIKIVLDFLLLIKIFHFYNQPFNFLRYLLNSLCYPFFCMYVVILSFNKEYHWKTRTFKK